MRSQPHRGKLPWKKRFPLPLTQEQRFPWAAKARSQEPPTHQLVPQMKTAVGGRLLVIHMPAFEGQLLDARHRSN